MPYKSGCQIYYGKIGNKRGTVKTKSRSSNIMASWISNGTRSKGSCFPLPFTLGALALDTTRELSGARTKDVSAINEESFWSTKTILSRTLFSKCKRRTRTLWVIVTRTMLPNINILICFVLRMSMTAYRRDGTCDLKGRFEFFKIR